MFMQESRQAADVLAHGGSCFWSRLRADSLSALLSLSAGHTIPALQGNEFQQLEGFLKAQLESLRGSEDGSAGDSKL